MSVLRSALSRRDFVNGALGVDAILATQDSQRSHAQPARRMIVDSQVHLWKAESPDWPWVPGLKPQLPEPMTIERLLPLMDEAGVDRVVVVPPSWPGGRNDYGIEAARRYPDRFHVRGRIPLRIRNRPICCRPGASSPACSACGSSSSVRRRAG
jgi:L-fuconolactonase